MLGGSAMTFGALFRTVATAAGSPPGAELSAAQRLRVVAAATAERLPRLGPLRRSASRPGFAAACERLLGELQAAGIEPEAVEASAATLEGSAYLADVATLYSAYAAARDRLGRIDSHAIARAAVAALRQDPSFWRRPVFLYGLDDLTPNQFDLVVALAAATEVTIAVPFEDGSPVLEARKELIGQLLAAAPELVEEECKPDPANTESHLLYALARGFGLPGAPDHRTRLEPHPAALGRRPRRGRGDRRRGLAAAPRRRRSGRDRRRAPRSRPPRPRRPGGTRGERDRHRARGRAAGRRHRRRRRPRRPARGRVRRPPRRRPAALPARAVRLPAGQRRLARADAAAGPGRERRGGADPLPRHRWRAAVRPAAAARGGGALARRARRRGGTAGGDDGLAAAARRRRRAAAWPRRRPRAARRRRDRRVRSPSWRSWAPWRRGPRSWQRPSPAFASAPGRGPVEGRVRIADPYRLRAGRFDHVVVGSLQDGEFPRRDRGADPFLSESQRESLGLDPRRDREAEERYLFQACLALPRRTPPPLLPRQRRERRRRGALALPRRRAGAAGADARRGRAGSSRGCDHRRARPGAGGRAARRGALRARSRPRARRPWAERRRRRAARNGRGRRRARRPARAPPRRRPPAPRPPPAPQAR